MAENFLLWPFNNVHLFHLFAIVLSGQPFWITSENFIQKAELHFRSPRKRDFYRRFHLTTEKNRDAFQTYSSISFVSISTQETGAWLLSRIYPKQINQRLQQSTTWHTHAEYINKFKFVNLGGRGRYPLSNWPTRTLKESENPISSSQFTTAVVSFLFSFFLI